MFHILQLEECLNRLVFLLIVRLIYYNLRHRALSAEKYEFAGLVVALEEAGFVYECHIKEEIDQAGKVVDAQLQQIWFALSEQIWYAQCFIAGWTSTFRYLTPSKDQGGDVNSRTTIRLRSV
jgi:hypothetical protein